MMTSAKPYAGKLYYVGDTRIAQSLFRQQPDSFDTASLLAPLCANGFPYDGKAVDAPILIISSLLPQGLDDSMRASLQNAFGKQQPILLLEGTRERQQELAECLLGTPMSAESNPGETALLIAFQSTATASYYWRFQADGKPAQTDLAAIISSWLTESALRAKQNTPPFRQEALRALSGQNGAQANLLDEVKGFNSNFVYQNGSNTYQLTYWIYAVHDFATQDDWFYVRQEGLFNAQGNYSSQEVHCSGVPSYTDRSGYIGSYSLESRFLPGLERVAVAELFRPSPQSAPGSEESTETTMKQEFGGELGFEGTKPAGMVHLTLGVDEKHIVKHKSCEFRNESTGSPPVARWVYQFREVEPVWSKNPLDLHLGYEEPSIYQRGSFQPVNCWLWRLPGIARKHAWGQLFRNEFRKESLHSYGIIDSLFFRPRPMCDRVCDFSVKEEIWLPYPPLLMVDRYVEFGKAHKTITLEFVVGEAWSASSNAPWCTVDPAAGDERTRQIHITVERNETAGNRSASITFRYAEGDGLRTVVTQVLQTLNE